jgi:hypothetical protein
MVEIASLAAVAALAKQGVDVLGGATSIYEKIKGTNAEEDPEGLKKLASELADELFKARMMQLEIQAKVQELQLEAQAEDEFKETLALYHVRELPAGGKVLALREPDESGRLFEHVCPTCATKVRQLFALQGGDRHFVLTCPNCDTRYPNHRPADRI